MIVEIQNWLEWRRAGIGGSDVAGILGLSKWLSPLDIWEAKKGLRGEQSQNHAMAWGSRLEASIRDFWASKHGITVTPSLFFESEKNPVLRASLDGWINDQEILEIKTSRTSEGWGEEGTDEIPTPYICQVQHYLNVVDAQRSEEHTSELQSHHDLVCRLLLEKKKKRNIQRKKKKKKSKKKRQQEK